jgi:uncharacterized protein (TIGR03435 family)
MNHQIVQKVNFSKKRLLAGAALLAVAGPVMVGVIHAPAVRAESPQSHSQSAQSAAISPDKATQGVYAPAKSIQMAQAQTVPGSARTSPPGPSREPSKNAAPPQFDVASVKVNTSGTAASRFLPAGGTVDGRNVVLKLLLNYAYGVEGFNISGGPGWINSERFDVQAKAAPNTPDSRMRIMMQALLADRFGLQVHRETKDSRVLVLTAAKGGIKLQPLKEGSCVFRDDPSASPGSPVAGQKPICGMPRSGVNGPNLVIDAVGMDTTLWVRTLSSMLGRTVVNETGLSGPLDVLHFEYSRDDLTAAVDSDAISISTALNQQLGLRLEAATRPLEVLVIDRIEQPSAN